jgi:hypothetical protein
MRFLFQLTKIKAVDKTMHKIINDIADQLPVIMEPSSELHHVLGEDLLAQGEKTLTNGERIIATKKYSQYMPVMIAMNHRRRLRKAYEDGGGDGIAAYIGNVNNMIDVRIAATKKIKEKVSLFTHIQNFLCKTLMKKIRKEKTTSLQVVR